MHTTTLRRICRYIVLTVAATAAVGCGSAARVAAPTASEYDAARGGRAAVVLLRAVTETHEGGERTAFGPGAAGDGTALSVARLADGGKLATAPVRSPAAAAMAAGWVYLVVKPGTYYLAVHDPPPGGLAPGPVAEGEDWLLEVPAGSPLVYAGTVVFPPVPSSKELPRHEGLPGPVATSARDDSAGASDVASRYFSNLTAGPGAAVRTIVMRRYSGAVDRPASAPQRSAGGAPPGLRVLADGAPRPTGFGVQGACAQDGAWVGLREGKPILSTGGSSTNTVADLFLFMVKVGLYAYAGTGAIVGSVAGVGEAREIQPCVTQAVRWAGEYDLAARLSESLTRRVGAGGAANPAAGGRPDDDRPLLRVTVQELHLRPCTKAHLACVEAKVRVRLWDPRAGRYEMDRILLYSNPAARHRTEPYGAPVQPYVLPIDESPVLNLRSLGRLAPQDRRRAVEAELARAVATLSDRIVGALSRLAVPTSRPAPDTRPATTRPAATRTAATRTAATRPAATPPAATRPTTRPPINSRQWPADSRPSPQRHRAADCDRPVESSGGCAAACPTS